MEKKVSGKSGKGGNKPTRRPRTEEPELIPRSLATDIIIQIARGIKDAGIKKLNCGLFDTMSTACCDAWNDLIGGLDGRNVNELAQEVLLRCGGHVE